MVSAHMWNAGYIQEAIEAQTPCPQEICCLDKETKEKYHLNSKRIYKPQ